MGVNDKVRNLLFRHVYLVVFAMSVAVVSCNRDLDNALEFAGDNRIELERVLDHFREDPDPLKYEAAVFLIENMPYHASYAGPGIAGYDSLYLAMSARPIQERDSFFREGFSGIVFKEDKRVRDIQAMKAESLILFIENACRKWRGKGRDKEFPKEIFLDYVVAYRIYDEPLSDWQNAIIEKMPYLTDSRIRSRRGQTVEAEVCNTYGCSIEKSENAVSGKYVRMQGPGSSISYRYESGVDESRLMSFRYATFSEDVKMDVIHNGKLITGIELEPTGGESYFKGMRRRVELKDRKGENELSLVIRKGETGIDNIELFFLADSDPGEHGEGFARHLYRIKNKETGGYVTFSNDRREGLKKISLLDGDEAGPGCVMKIDRQGSGSWSIVSVMKDSIEQCLELQEASAAVGAYLGQYDSHGWNHQRWLFIPLEDGSYRIVSKDSGLSLDAVEGDDMTFVRLMPYTGRDSQRWILEKSGKRESIDEGLFATYESISDAARIYDMTDCYEWIGFQGNVMPSVASVVRGRTGNCREESAFTVFLCRSLGIPATVDFTPQWANRSQAHLWSVLIKPDGKGVPFYMGHMPGDTINYFHPFLKPKVFRHRFRLNREIAADLRYEKDIPRLFVNADFIDVTDEYYDAVDVERPVPDSLGDHKVAYVCVFDNRDWVPVHYGNIRKGKVTFRSMVKGVAYIQAMYRNGRVVPFGNPFVLTADGGIMDLIADGRKKKEMTLLRKYPFMAEQDLINHRMHGGRFQVSDRQDFSDAKDIFVHDGVTQGNWYDVEVETDRPYKYVRYLSPAGSYGNINEIEFVSPSGERLSGEVTGTEGNAGKGKETVFDGDILTGFDARTPDGNWVGMKFSSGRRISRIRYIARNDGNCIEKGDEYELLVWMPGGWKSYGRRKADADFLQYGDIPSGGLYLLRNHTKGKEERIFTYKDGKQIFW